MKILLLTSEFAPQSGGIGTYAKEIAAAAWQLGAEIDVVAPDYGGPTDDSEFPFKVSRFHGGLHSMRDLPAKIRLVHSKTLRTHYDIVHAADWPFFIPVAMSRLQINDRILMTVHGTEINETQTPLKRLAIRCTGVFGPRVEVVANSGFTRDLFQERFPIESNQINAVPLGVSDFWFSPPTQRSRARWRYGIDSGRIAMVTVARLTRRKGFHLTLKALESLPDAIRNSITWLVVGPPGETEYVQEFREMVDESPCDVRLLGALQNEEIRDLYSAADFFCLTGVPDSSGRVEGFGLVYLEAAACGLPSIASAIGGVPDAVIDRSTGLLTPPQPSAVADAIARISLDDKLRADLASSAKLHAQEMSWRRCAAQTYGLPYTSLSHHAPGQRTLKLVPTFKDARKPWQPVVH
jgi:glycosyltransferase involved in cell wall biosynthesis